MKLQVLTYQREGLWFAMGLEHCIFAKGVSLPETVQRFLSEIAMQVSLDQVEGYPPLSETPPAPADFWERYQQSQFRLVIDFPLPKEIQEFIPEIRVAA